jgi:hypothetical protein
MDDYSVDNNDIKIKRIKYQKKRKSQTTMCNKGNYNV